MAIDKMQKITVLCPAHAAHRLMKAMHRLGVVELVDASEELGDGAGALRKHEASTVESDSRLQQANFILGLIESFYPKQQGFFEGLTPLPLIVDTAELEKATRSYDLDLAYQMARELDDIHKRAERRTAEIKAQIDNLTPLEDVPLTVADLKLPKSTRLIFGTIPTKGVEGFQSYCESADFPLAGEIVVPGFALRKDLPKNGGSYAEAMATKGPRTRVVAAVLREDEERARQYLAGLQFEEVPLPAISGKVRDRLRELQGDMDECRKQIQQAREGAGRLAEARRTVEILKAHWESVRNREAARACALEGDWIHLFRGFVRRRDSDRVREAIQHELPEASVEIEEPAPGEVVPVSLTQAKVVRPVQMLVDLFGLPAYEAFDPSPFIVINFYLFFGICFGDVGYGLLLMALGGYLAYKTRMYEGVYNFSRLLFFAGVSTLIFGALFGSWLGDLYDPKYLGEGNVLLRLKETFMIIDPLNDPVRMLVVALSIGMLNQFYGIALNMYGAARNGDWITAICDGLFWLIALPGMVIMISVVFVDLPPGVFNIGLAMFAAGGIGLVLSQGRNSPGIVGKVGTGIISLYGIVGSYGCTAFIGDTLSYCRLLALALTTSIVALTVNMIAGLMRDIPAVGPVLFVLVIVAGHAFNFAISLLGAFVHAMRLIFVEFFGRFYSGGARRFSPLGFDTPTCKLKQPGEAGS